MRRQWIALLALMVMVLAACGGNGETTDDDPGDDGADTDVGDDAPEDDDGDAPGDDGAADDLTFGVANFALHSAFFIALEAAIVEEAASLGIQTISTDAGQDAASLTSDVEDLIAQGVDGVILQASPLETAPSVTEALADAGIPLVMVNRKLTDATYASWIGGDNSYMGVAAGEYIADRLGGEGKVVIISGGPADNTTGIARNEGLRSQLEDTDIEIVQAPGFGDWSEDGGIAIMEDLLVSHDDIDAVFCENDAMCLGAMNAIEDAGRADEIFLVGVDGTAEALAAIADGTIFVATAQNDAAGIGRAGVQALLAVINGEDVEQDTEIQGPLITADNVQEHIAG